MAQLTIHRKMLLKVGVPLWLFINEQPVGVMQGRAVSITLPEGSYTVSVRLLLRLWRWTFRLGGSRQVEVREGEPVALEITDHERWWNILFDVDLVLCLLKCFVRIPSPWGLVYEVLSDGFFAVWLLRLWRIRDRYYVLRDKR